MVTLSAATPVNPLPFRWYPDPPEELRVMVAAVALDAIRPVEKIAKMKHKVVIRIYYLARIRINAQKLFGARRSGSWQSGWLQNFKKLDFKNQGRTGKDHLSRTVFAICD